VFLHQGGASLKVAAKRVGVVVDSVERALQRGGQKDLLTWLRNDEVLTERRFQTSGVR
jgi:hypothetical protein